MPKAAAGAFDINPDPWSDFYWSETDEPHASRRKEILSKHPEIRSLFRPEPLTAVVSVGIFALQIFMAYHVRNWSFWPFLAATYVVSGTVNHTLQLAAHEISHNLAFYNPTANRCLAIFCNLATGFPSGSTFRRYHMLHHQQQGVHGVDVDVPTALEARVVGSAAWKKLIWTLMQPLFYSLRPAVVMPLSPNRWEVANVVIQVLFNVSVVHFLGYHALLYMTLGTILGMGLHPAAGHFIAEHYMFLKGQETYSYYGSANIFNLNVGYHNEHHDFPRVPWTALPKIKKMAPEYYDNLPHHTSYVKIFWDYITDPTMGPYSRVKRLRRGADTTKGRLEAIAADERASKAKTNTSTHFWFKVAAFTFIPIMLIFSIVSAL